jgi:hypothetical protein
MCCASIFVPSGMSVDGDHHPGLLLLTWPVDPLLKVELRRIDRDQPEEDSSSQGQQESLVHFTNSFIP